MSGVKRVVLGLVAALTMSLGVLSVGATPASASCDMWQATNLQNFDVVFWWRIYFGENQTAGWWTWWESDDCDGGYIYYADLDEGGSWWSGHGQSVATSHSENWDWDGSTYVTFWTDTSFWYHVFGEDWLWWQHAYQHANVWAQWGWCDWSGDPYGSDMDCNA